VALLKLANSLLLFVFWGAWKFPKPPLSPLPPEKLLKSKFELNPENPAPPPTLVFGLLSLLDFEKLEKSVNLFSGFSGFSFFGCPDSLLIMKLGKNPLRIF